MLLSSLFVYNQLGAIDEAALDRLGLVSEVARSLAGKAAGAKAGAPEADVARFAPAFLWLLRDFYLELKKCASNLISSWAHSAAARAHFAPSFAARTGA